MEARDLRLLCDQGQCKNNFHRFKFSSYTNVCESYIHKSMVIIMIVVLILIDECEIWNWKNILSNTCYIDIFAASVEFVSAYGNAL